MIYRPARRLISALPRYVRCFPTWLRLSAPQASPSRRFVGACCTSGVEGDTFCRFYQYRTGAVAVMNSDAVTSAVLMPLTVSAPVSAHTPANSAVGTPACHASAGPDGVQGLSSEKIPGSTKAVSSSPPIASSSACSPTEGPACPRTTGAGGQPVQPCSLDRRFVRGTALHAVSTCSPPERMRLPRIAPRRLYTL